ncbi:MAG: type IV pilin protein [Egibacteraceae bacterium]
MFLAIRKRLEEREEGFTLIELLVVVIIIGILAAIAIPVFLNQRQRGYQAALTSDVRNSAIEVESAFTANGTFPADQAAFTALDWQKSAPSGVTETLTYSKDSDSYCVVATRSDLNGGTAKVIYDSDDGGIQPYSEDGTATCSL